MPKTAEGPLVRATIRLPQTIYDRLRHRSYSERRSLQAVHIETLERGLKRQERYATPEELLAFKVRMKKGQKLPTRAELYEEVLDHRIRSH